jgi:hypothetical protein
MMWRLLTGPYAMTLLRANRFLLAILLFNLVLAVPSLWVPYYNIDEITNAIYAKFILSGQLKLCDFVGNTYFLTHYIYAVIGKLFGFSSLIPVHVFHAFWKCLTILALYHAGRELGGRKVGLWAALFYCVGSLCYMSKDFHTPIAESFSLFPAALAAGAVFRGMNRHRWIDYFLAGIFAAAATLFKTPMGVTIVALNLLILVRRNGFVVHFLAVNAGFFSLLILPILLVSPFGYGFHYLAERLHEVNSVYIQSYDGMSRLYWILKFLMRTAMVLGASLGMTVFAIYPYRTLLSWRKRHRDYWQKISFLFIWAFLLWLTVCIGERVFYHYFVFLFVPLPLLAAAGIKAFDTRLCVQASFKQRPRLKADDREEFYFLRFVRRHLFLFLGIPLLAFSIDGAFNFSTMPPKLDAIIDFVQKQTKPGDPIYVWGSTPQIYFYADRQPATTAFWSEFFSGSSPGSPAMEYIRATGQNLTLSDRLIKDLNANVFKRKRVSKLTPETTLYDIEENELFTLSELLERIENKYWRKVFADFFLRPPVLFIDSSPLNIHGFGNYPIYRYELVKRFILDNYRLLGRVNDMYVYRLTVPLQSNPDYVP